MRYEVCEDRDYPGQWRAEASGDDGECYVAIFCGPKAETKAREYAAWKNDEVFVEMRSHGR